MLFENKEKHPMLSEDSDEASTTISEDAGLGRFSASRTHVARLEKLIKMVKFLGAKQLFSQNRRQK